MVFWGPGRGNSRTGDQGVPGIGRVVLALGGAGLSAWRWGSFGVVVGCERVVFWGVGQGGHPSRWTGGVFGLGIRVSPGVGELFWRRVGGLFWRRGEWGGAGFDILGAL